MVRRMNQTILIPIRVHKLIGKPAFVTVADCESKARRTHWFYDDVLPRFAAKSNAFRNQCGQNPDDGDDNRKIEQSERPRGT